jgi:hypothetical protein
MDRGSFEEIAILVDEGGEIERVLAHQTLGELHATSQSATRLNPLSRLLQSAAR